MTDEQYYLCQLRDIRIARDGVERSNDNAALAPHDKKDAWVQNADGWAMMQNDAVNVLWRL